MRLCPRHWREPGSRSSRGRVGGDVVRMSRQMGWDGVGEAGGEGGELMGEGGMPLVCAQGWKESLVLSSSPEPVPKSHAPTVLNKHTERRGENGKRKCGGPCLAQTEDSHLDLDPHFQVPLSCLF